MEAINKNPELIANFFLIGGGILFAMFPRIALEWWVFVFFLAGHFVYTIHNLRKNDRSQVVLNVGLMILDIYAIIIRM